MCGCGLEASGKVYGPGAGSCEDGNNPSVSVKERGISLTA
jgi:hypothetical protein